jgi:hypothetical protein
MGSQKHNETLVSILFRTELAYDVSEIHGYELSPSIFGWIAKHVKPGEWSWYESSTGDFKPVFNFLFKDPQVAMMFKLVWK